VPFLHAAVSPQSPPLQTGARRRGSQGHTSPQTLKLFPLPCSAFFWSGLKTIIRGLPQGLNVFKKSVFFLSIILFCNQTKSFARCFAI